MKMKEWFRKKLKDLVSDETKIEKFKEWYKDYQKKVIMNTIEVGMYVKERNPESKQVEKKLLKAYNRGGAFSIQTIGFNMEDMILRMNPLMKTLTKQLIKDEPLLGKLYKITEE